MTLLHDLRSSARPLLDDLVAELSPALPLLADLDRTPQDAARHAEGSVGAHTLLALLEAYEVADEHGLAGEERLTLILATLLHDVGKVLATTRERDDAGRPRTVAPRHAEVGRSYLAYRLPDLGLSPATIWTVMGLVGRHHDLARASRSGEERAFRALAREVDLPALYRLGLANARGRVADDVTARVEELEFFRLQAEAFGLWGVPDPYADWRAEVGAQMADFPPTLREFVLAQGVLDFEAGAISTPHEAVARSYGARGGFADLVVTCGPSGSGKAAWAATHLRDREVIALDLVRADLEARQKTVKVGHVLQEAKERLRAALRAKRPVAWLGANVRASHRALPLGLGRDYGALTTLAVFQPSLRSVFAPGASEVPASVRAAEVDAAEFPDLAEAHRTLVLDEYGWTALSFGFAFGAPL